MTKNESSNSKPSKAVSNLVSRSDAPRSAEIKRIYCCQPGYGPGSADSHKAFWTGAVKTSSSHRGMVTLVFGGRSLLANTFNNFWCHALNLQLNNARELWKSELLPTCDNNTDGEEAWYATNKRLNLKAGPFDTQKLAEEECDRQHDFNDITHFAMLHDDVAPEDGWLDVLLEDLEAHDADMVSAVVPIKDPLGLTSTAIDDPTDRFNVERRITMDEVMRLPPVFSAADCGYPDRILLVNSGCWVCRFTEDWRFNVRFVIDDRIVFKGDHCRPEMPAQYAAEVAPEDWNFSRNLASYGCKVLATRRVKLTHSGGIAYTNSEPWGGWKHDMAFEHKFGAVPICAVPEPVQELLDLGKQSAVGQDCCTVGDIILGNRKSPPETESDQLEEWAAFPA
jgi:hypothetical protein